MHWTVKGTVELFKYLTEVLVLNETGEFYPATASLFNVKSAVSGNEPRVVVKHSSYYEVHKVKKDPLGSSSQCIVGLSVTVNARR